MQQRTRRIAASGVLALGLLAGCSGTPQEREVSHMKKGKQYFDAKEYRKAAIEYKVASQNMPKDTEPLYRLGLVYLAGGAVKLAVETFEQVLTIDPKHQASQYQLALLKVGASKLDLVEEGKDVVIGWIANHPGDADAIASLGLAEAKLGNRQEALKHLEAAAAKDPKTLRIASLVIAVYAAKGDDDAAREVARDLADRLPNSPEAAVMRAQVSLATHDVPDADAQLSKALSLKHDYRPALQLRLRRELMDGNAGAAEETTKQLAQLPEKRMWGAYARVLFSENRIEQGKAEYERVIREHNDDPDLRDDYASTLVTAGRPKAAEDVVTGTLQSHPKDAAARMIRTILEVDRGDYASADKDIKALKDEKALSPQLTYREARLFAARGDLTKEGDLLTQVLQQDPRFLSARLELARVMIAGNKARNALDILDQAPEAQKKTAGFVFERNTALLAAGEFDEARKQVDEALHSARLPGFLYQDAILRAQKNDLAGARKSLDEAFASAPADPLILSMLGQVMKLQGQSAQYVALVKEAAAKNPGSAALQNTLGNALLTSGDNGGARAAFESASAKGDVTSSEVELALMDLRAGSAAKARERLTDLTKEHDSARVRLVLAQVDAQAGSPDAAIQDYLKAVELDPRNVLAMNNLANMLADRKKYDDALFWGQKALALAPNSPVLADTIGWLYYRQAKYDLALPYLEKSLRGMDRPVAHYHLAAELINVGEADRAKKEYDLALKADPKSPERATVDALFAGKAR
ncbi:MAG: tetratricopeptide repeat protein [Acidobacteriota bacterium]|nr:tetratricopeptide repeat protein [Acidobacteriota bacterium]